LKTKLSWGGINEDNSALRIPEKKKRRRRGKR
jgi:hypothetical protein